MTDKLQTFSDRTAVHGLVFDQDDKVLLLKRSDNDRDEPNTWDTPGGGLDPGDQLESAFLRECQEEAGINVSEVKIVAAYTLDDLTLQFVAFAKTTDTNVKISFEHKEYLWVNLNELLEIQPAGLHLKAFQYLIKNQLKLVDYPTYDK